MNYMEETIKIAKLSTIALFFKLLLDFFAIAILIGLIWMPRDIIRFLTTKLEITNKRLKGKVGLINTNELDSPLNKINSIQVKQRLFGKIFNYGTLVISTSSSIFYFDYVINPREFKTVLNNQIEDYEEEKMTSHAKKIANAIEK